MPASTPAADPVGVFRFRRIICVLAVVPFVAGCAGADGQEAIALLQQASTAQQSVKSLTFSANVKIDGGGAQNLGFRLKGGGYSKGTRAGDFFIDMEMTGSLASLGASAAPFPGGKFRIAHVGGRAWLEMGGRKMAFPAPLMAGSARSTSKSSALAGFDFTRYVKDVRVEGGHVLNGRATTKIVGVLDSASLLEDAAKLQGMAAGTGQAMPDLGKYLSDTRVVVFIDDQTHLVSAALADLEAKDGGEHVKLHLDFAITSINKRVALPRG